MVVGAMIVADVTVLIAGYHYSAAARTGERVLDATFAALALNAAALALLTAVLFARLLTRGAL